MKLPWTYTLIGPFSIEMRLKESLFATETGAYLRPILELLLTLLTDDAQSAD
jgi:hypothetical protein